MYFERCDRPITLQRMSMQVDDLTGEASLVVAEEFEIWAQFKALQGSEAFEGLAERARARAMFIIRFRTDVESQGWRIKDDRDRLWDIVGEPREIGRRSGLELACVRMVSDGRS